MASSTLLLDTANSLLSVAEEVLDAEGILPQRSYVSEGDVAFDDCPALVVQFVRGFRGLPGQEIVTGNPCAQPRSATFWVWVIRCAAELSRGGSVSTAAMEASATEKLIDAWVLPSGISKKTGEITGSCNDVVVGECVITGPSGARVAVRLTVTIQIGGN